MVMRPQLFMISESGRQTVHRADTRSGPNLFRQPVKTDLVSAILSLFRKTHGSPLAVTAHGLVMDSGHTSEPLHT
jgi:hypothetical protein